MLEKAYSVLYIVTLTLLGVAIFAAMMRSVTGKTIINRFIGINILTTLIAVTICILSLALDEAYLPDVAVVYVLLSCIAVMILNKIYINLFRKEQNEKEDNNA